MTQRSVVDTRFKLWLRACLAYGFVAGLRWHLQVGADSGPQGAERVDVVAEPDKLHPHVHPRKLMVCRTTYAKQPT